MSEISLTNIINVSVAAAGAGAGKFNTSNLAIFTHEPFNPSFGVLGYKQVVAPKEVGEDFGTSSQTFAQANAIFSQKPNILAGGGQLVIIPLIEAIQNFALDGVPASGSFTLTYLGNPTAAINWDDTAAQIQVKVRAVAGLAAAVVTGSLASQSLNIDFQGVYGAVALLTVGGVGLQTVAPAPIVITPTTTQAGETLAAAVTRTSTLVQYFALMGARVFSQVDMLAAAAVVQALMKMAVFVSRTSADIAPGGMLDLLRSGALDHSRGLYYGSNTDSEALIMAAAYAGRAFSTDFTGSNTTSTMHLKTLVGIQPDPSLNQTLYNQAKAAGADIYASFEGTPRVASSGANTFFDRVYNLLWFVTSIQIAEFNFLAQTGTKIPQTEQGMDAFKKVERGVCVAAVNNGFVAPGEWTSATTFGNQNDFYDNIRQQGYYIFSQPISQQLQVDREDRIAPLSQIALKEAGAIHSGNILVNVNA